MEFEYDLAVQCKTEEEAKVAVAAIAQYLKDKKCKCDYDVGYTCDLCKKFSIDDEGQTYYRFMERYTDLIYRNRVMQ